MATATSSKLFEPIKVGKTLLRHRVVMAPMTRQRATEAHVPTELMAEYYAQRASAPGTLLISEGTYISEKAVGVPRVPGIWSKEQIDGWKKVTDAVHAKGSFISLQLWATGRAARPDFLASRDLPYTGVSPIQHPWHTVPPRPLTLPEISDYIAAFGTAASNAVDLAGFDAVEIHGANGFLVDQFLQTNTNAREDAYGGSVENRIRFADEVVDAVVNAVGAERTGIRLSPWSTFQAMGMPDPIPTFEALVRRIDSKHPDLGWIHVVEPDQDPEPAPSTNSGAATDVDVVPPTIERSNAFIDAIRLPRPVIHSNGYTLASALAATTSSSSDPTSNRDGVLIGFGRAFLANPDLPSRLRSQANAAANGELDGGVEMNVPDPETFYAGEEVGYVDYPFAPQPQKAPVSNIVLTGAQAALLSVKA